MKNNTRLITVIGMVLGLALLLPIGESMLGNALRPVVNTPINSIIWRGRKPIFQLVEQTKDDVHWQILNDKGEVMRESAIGYAFYGSEDTIIFSGDIMGWDDRNDDIVVEEYRDGTFNKIPINEVKQNADIKPFFDIVGVSRSSDNTSYFFPFGETEQHVESANIVFTWNRFSHTWVKKSSRDQIIQDAFQGKTTDTGLHTYDKYIDCGGLHCENPRVQYLEATERVLKKLLWDRYIPLGKTSTNMEIRLENSWWGNKSINVYDQGKHTTVVSWFNNSEEVSVVKLSESGKFLLSVLKPFQTVYLVDAETGAVALLWQDASKSLLYAKIDEISVDAADVFSVTPLE